MAFTTTSAENGHRVFFSEAWNPKPWTASVPESSPSQSSCKASADSFNTTELGTSPQYERRLCRLTEWHPPLKHNPPSHLHRRFYMCKVSNLVSVLIPIPEKVVILDLERLDNLIEIRLCIDIILVVFFSSTLEVDRDKNIRLILL